MRFHAYGDPCAPLHASDGTITNVVRRRREPRDGCKVLGLRGCPTPGTLIGRIGDIGLGGDTVIVEGVADAWTAALAWPAAVVLGAHSAQNYPRIARVVARRVLAAGGRLLMTVDDDATGERYAYAAAVVAIELGLAWEHSLVIVDLGNAHDLADAWRDGWRPEGCRS